MRAVAQRLSVSRTKPRKTAMVRKRRLRRLARIVIEDMRRMPKTDRRDDARTQIIRLLLVGEEVAWQRLDTIRAELSVEVFGGHGWSAPPNTLNDPRVADVLDVLHAVEMLDSNEPAFAWNRAGLLCDLGKYAEAAEEFLEAARRLDVGIAEGLIGSDEKEWSEAARAYASRALLQARRVMAATVVWRQLTDNDYREDVKAKIELAMRDPEAARESIDWIPHPRWQDLRA